MKKKHVFWPKQIVSMALVIVSLAPVLEAWSNPKMLGCRSRNVLSLSLPVPMPSRQPYLQLSASNSVDEEKPSSPASSSPSTLWTVQELEDFCDRRGITISFTTLGPGYRAVARLKEDESMILGYVEGFVRPAGQILHLDKMEIFQKMVAKAKTQRQEKNSHDLFLDFGGISFGIGLLMGYRCLLHAMEKQCSIAEFLAIDDEDFQHKRLVRYYKRVGFRVVKYVGEDVTDIPDRLVWGGCGTLMKEDIDVLVKKWAALISLMEKRAAR